MHAGEDGRVILRPDGRSGAARKTGGDAGRCGGVIGGTLRTKCPQYWA